MSKQKDKTELLKLIDQLVNGYKELKKTSISYINDFDNLELKLEVGEACDQLMQTGLAVKRLLGLAMTFSEDEPEDEEEVEVEVEEEIEEDEIEEEKKEEDEGGLEEDSEDESEENEDDLYDDPSNPFEEIRAVVSDAVYGSMLTAQAMELDSYISELRCDIYPVNEKNRKVMADLTKNFYVLREMYNCVEVAVNSGE